MDIVDVAAKGSVTAVDGAVDTGKAALKFLTGASKAGGFFGLGELVCRLCGKTINLLGAWKCECGFTRPGNYFERYPNCGRYSHYID